MTNIIKVQFFKGGTPAGNTDGLRAVWWGPLHLALVGVDAGGFFLMPG